MPTERFIDIPIVKIDPEFQSLIPTMVKEERDALEASILADGCRDAIIVWNDLIVDGHRRYEICQAHGIDFIRVHKDFESRDQAKIWIISNQFARRNLTPKQISYLRGIRQKIERGETISSSDKLAKEYGVSARTIERDVEFAEAVDKMSPEEKSDVLSGKQKKTKGELTGKTTPTKTPLYHLKKWWDKASEDERNYFRGWIME
ncbi:MAG: ParB/RepB/Spo0J family partition protein [Candidatus Methanoperedens sp.]|nr:ParB/RepB/Spo0J family partition protein [Candidatus Methanoperedens sp.]